MTIPVRCFNRIGGTVCFTRRSLSRPPSQYSAERYIPRCPSCGARKWMIDKYRVRRELGPRNTCYCGGYHFIHRKGSKYCEHNPNYEANWAERLGYVEDGAWELGRE